MTARFADNVAQHLLRVTEVADKALVTARFFDGVQVAALNVLDQCDFERHPVIQVADDGRHFMQSGRLCGAPTPFAGNNFIALPGNWSDQDRLQHTMRAYRRNQVVHRGGIEMTPRLRCIGADISDCQPCYARTIGIARRRSLLQQRGKPASKTRNPFLFSHLS